MYGIDYCFFLFVALYLVNLSFSRKGTHRGYSTNVCIRHAFIASNTLFGNDNPVVIVDRSFVLRPAPFCINSVVCGMYTIPKYDIFLLCLVICTPPKRITTRLAHRSVHMYSVLLICEDTSNVLTRFTRKGTKDRTRNMRVIHKAQIT